MKSSIANLVKHQLLVCGWSEDEADTLIRNSNNEELQTILLTQILGIFSDWYRQYLSQRGNKS